MSYLPSLLIAIHNAIYRRMWPASRIVSPSRELNEIADRAASVPTDISDHLTTIFSETVQATPRLIVELGVRGGESRFALEKAATVTGAVLVSVDIEDCSDVCNRDSLWYFVKSDDVEFAAVFKDWCSQRAIDPRIDVLFIDTSHIYEHTVKEIREWFPYLSTKGKVLFHDTNSSRFYRRLDGTLSEGWNCKRGVIQPIEQYLGIQLDERRNFTATVSGWVIRHWAHCNGFTVMERTPLQPTDDENPSAGRSRAHATSH